MDLLHQMVMDDNSNIWVKQMAGGTLNDVGNSIWLNSAGSEIITTGYFQNTVDFDPGAGISNLTSLGTGDVFVSKLPSCCNPRYCSSVKSSMPIAAAISIALFSGLNSFLDSSPSRS